MNGEVHGETAMHNYVNRCLLKWIFIPVAIEAAMLEDSMTSRENALYVDQAGFHGYCKHYNTCYVWGILKITAEMT